MWGRGRRLLCPACGAEVLDLWGPLGKEEGSGGVLDDEGVLERGEVLVGDGGWRGVE